MTRDLLVAAATVLIAAALFVHRPAAEIPAIRADPRRTPGALNPAVVPATIRDTICKRGWTKTIRPPTSYTNELKLEQMRAYRRTGGPHAYQEDHLISLELGGHPTDRRNLWPEPLPHAYEVDQVENELNDRVCSGKLTLADAQRRESLLKHTSG